MKKIILILSLLALIASACNLATKQQSVEENVQNETEVEENQSQKTLKYLYNDFGFFDDGTCVSDINSPNPELTDTYHEFPTFLVVGKHAEWEFFDDFGHITPSWKIINYHKVNSPMQVTNFETSTENITKSDIQNIKETCLIIIRPAFDSSSEDAGEIAADWDYYANETSKRYEEAGIKTEYAKKQYLRFTIADNEKIMIDTKKDQNGKIPPSALLYRKGYIPIMISISGESDEGNKLIEKYLHQ